MKGTVDKGLVFNRNKTATCDVTGLLILTMLVILTRGGPYLGISSLCVQVLSLGRHCFSLLQLYLLQRLSILLLLKV